MTTTADIGDVLAVRLTGAFARLIRLGAALRDQPNLVSHIAIVHHRDTSGALWVIEAWPGGVGYRIADHYLADRWTISNAAQAKTTTQRELIAQVAGGLLGTPYDWAGIAQDAMIAIGAQEKWNWRRPGGPPAHVVCSSLAAWVYDKAGLAHPMVHTVRNTTPADWEQFIIDGAP